MNTLRTLIAFPRDISQRTSISIDLRIVCLWATIGLVLTALMFTNGFSSEVGQVLAVAG
jgi:hypothetical protein